jgi:hypothetical protein
LSGRQYVATFKIEKPGLNKNVCDILLNKKKEVIDASPGCENLLGISFNSVNRKQVYYDMPTLLPSLFLNTSANYQSKAGG